MRKDPLKKGNHILKVAYNHISAIFLNLPQLHFIDKGLDFPCVLDFHFFQCFQTRISTSIPTNISLDSDSCALLLLPHWLLYMLCPN